MNVGAYSLAMHAHGTVPISAAIGVFAVIVVTFVALLPRGPKGPTL